jgi:hypothetical protein
MLGDVNAPMFFQLTLTWTVGNLYKYPDEEINRTFRPKLHEIFKMLRSALNKDAFNEALFVVSRVARTSDKETIQVIVDSGVHKNLVSFISSQTDKNELNMIFSILGNLYYANDIFIKETFDIKILKAFELYLEEVLTAAKSNLEFLTKNKETVKNFTWCLSNFAAVGNEKVRDRLIRHTQIPKLLLQLCETTFNPDILENVCFFFVNSLDTSNSNTKAEILRLKVLEFFVHNLGKKSLELKESCLEGIFKFLVYGETVMRDRNIVKDELIALGTNLEIDVMQNHTNQLIASMATELITNYFPSEGSTIDNSGLI